MKFLEACNEAISLTREHNTKHFVYEYPTAWHITPVYAGDGWLFQVYPGGRKILKPEGKEIAIKEGW